MRDVLVTVDVRRRRFTAEEYHRMGEAGVFGPNERVELIGGEIVEMSPIGVRHALCVAALSNRLARVIGERALLWPQNPIRLFPDTEPQPDVTFIKAPLSRYDSHPGPGDVVLLIEVADTSYRYDRDVKLPLYARAGVLEVWIVDLGRDTVEIFRDPSQEVYHFARRIDRGGTVAPLAFSDVLLAVEEILPPA
jgi:Uma2 family endonuclease